MTSSRKGPVLVPLDSSSVAEPALPEAVTMARALDSAIHLVHADETYTVFPDFPISTSRALPR